jgi:hypothetical protein
MREGLTNRGEQMTFQTEKKCPYCAETIRSAAEICRFCNRTVANAKPCTYCCEPLRSSATRCRFCQKDQGAISPWSADEPAVPCTTTVMPSYGFQLPVHNPVYTPIEPRKVPEQCLAEEEFKQWQQKRRDDITHGANNE